MAPIRLLIVDDEVKLVATYRQFFELKGFEVLTTNRGEEAVQLIEQHKPHAVLLDWRLEGSKLQGPDVLQRTKALSPRTAVLMYSGYGDREKEEALRLGADRFLEKPLILPQLVETIKQAVDARQQSATP